MRIRFAPWEDIFVWDETGMFSLRRFYLKWWVRVCSMRIKLGLKWVGHVLLENVPLFKISWNLFDMADQMIFFVFICMRSYTFNKFKWLWGFDGLLPEWPLTHRHLKISKYCTTLQTQSFTVSKLTNRPNLDRRKIYLNLVGLKVCYSLSTQFCNYINRTIRIQVIIALCYWDPFTIKTLWCQSNMSQY